MLGGGVAGCELAQLYRRLGSEVTIVQRNERLLPRIDAEAAEVLQARVRGGGDRAASSARTGRSCDARPRSGSSSPPGRAANAEGLGLEQLGATITQRGIETDERLRAAENVWAIGDCTTHPQFTHLGKYQARIAAADIAGRPAKADYRAIPAVAFTDPQIAAVGTTEGDGLVVGALERRGHLARLDLRAAEAPRLRQARRRPEGRRAGRRRRGRARGRRMVPAAHARDPRGRPVEILLDVIQPFPTFSEGVFWALRELEL